MSEGVAGRTTLTSVVFEAYPGDQIRKVFLDRLASALRAVPSTLPIPGLVEAEARRGTRLQCDFTGLTDATLPPDAALADLLKRYEPLLCDVLSLDRNVWWKLSVDIDAVPNAGAFAVVPPRVWALVDRFPRFRFLYFVRHRLGSSDCRAPLVNEDRRMRSEASLRIWGEDLDPDRITQVLGCAPTCGRIDNAVRPGRDGGDETALRRANWHFETERESEDLNGQIAEIFDRLNPDPQVWAALTRDHKVDLFCGLFMAKWNEGVTLSPEAMTILANRGIPLALDIYEHSNPVISDP